MNSSRGWRNFTRNASRPKTKPEAMQVQDDKPYDDINITPMLDLAYVLLVIFILMCTATAQGLRANLPRPGAASKSQPKNKPQIINVLPDGSTNLNSQPMSLDQLQMQ